MLSKSSRTLLLAGVSIAALTAASGHAKAADMATKAPPVARESVKDTWAWWIEGGAFGIAGRGIESQRFGPIDPKKWGAEGAVGFDWTGQPFSPWHLSGQFRYGQTKKSRRSFLVQVTTSSAVIGKQQLEESHELLDFAVGRDFALGSSQGQLKFGIRIADLKANVAGRGHATSAATTTFSFQQRHRFLGAGPRIGVEGSTPLGGAWSLDWLAGAALLVGERTFELPVFNLTQNAVFSQGLVVAVPNLDAQLGLSYWVSPGFKLTASYRVDGYFQALSVRNANRDLAKVDRFYQGPMLRLTYVTSAPSTAAPGGVAAALAYNWTGFYLGPHVGCGWSRFALSQFAVSDGGGDFTGLQASGDGCFAGGQAGYNYQFANRFVAGLEADAAFAGINGQGQANEDGVVENSFFRQKIKDFGTVRGRLGYAYERALPM
jgi:hypothetical protein